MNVPINDDNSVKPNMSYSKRIGFDHRYLNTDKSEAACLQVKSEADDGEYPTTQDIKIKLEPLVQEEIDIQEYTIGDVSQEVKIEFEPLLRGQHEEFSGDVKEEMENPNVKNDFERKKDEKFPNKSILEGHIKTTSKAYKCEKCDYQCLSKSYFKCHMRKHTGEKPYKCQLCDYKCADKSSLTRHIKRHTGEKSFKCDLCDYQCFQKHCLKFHNMQRHTGERPFKCNQCDYRCVQKNELSTHIKRHTGEKIFKCDLCDYRSAVRTDLRKHQKTCSAKKPLRCNQCDYQCRKKCDLNNHISVHPDLVVGAHEKTYQRKAV